MSSFNSIDYHKRVLEHKKDVIEAKKKEKPVKCFTCSAYAVYVAGELAFCEACAAECL